MKKIALYSGVLFAVPLVTFAQALTPIRTLVASIGSILNALIPLLIALAIVVFFWGLVQYIWKGAEGHTEGRNIMIAGLVSLFVMVSVWGIVALAQNALGVQGNAQEIVPQVPQASGY